MSTYKKIVIKATTNWIGSTTFNVVEHEIEGKKYGKTLNEIKLFSGSILECKAFIELFEKGVIVK